MSLLTESEVRKRAIDSAARLLKSTVRAIRDSIDQRDSTFDVFPSHSSSEPDEIISGITVLLEDKGLSVYVDKYVDPQLSPENVTRATAETLRRRMRNSSALLYIYSQHSKRSRWMPWELGFFDALKGKVGVVPVTRNQEEAFKTEEYLNLYPYVGVSGAGSLWINDGPGSFAFLEKWVRGTAQVG